MGESPEGVRAPQMMPAAPMGPLVVQQSMGAPVVYGTQNALPQGSIGHYFGPQGSNVVGLSQQSMCAGVPAREMASQYVRVVMAKEEMNPWSDAKRVEALTSSLLTHVKESTYPTAPQDLSSDREARKKEKLERLRIQILKNAEEKFCVAGRLSSKSWITWGPHPKVRT